MSRHQLDAWVADELITPQQRDRILARDVAATPWWPALLGLLAGFVVGFLVLAVGTKPDAASGTSIGPAMQILGAAGIVAALVQHRLSPAVRVAVLSAGLTLLSLSATFHPVAVVWLAAPAVLAGWLMLLVHVPTPVRLLGNVLMVPAAIALVESTTGWAGSGMAVGTLAGAHFLTTWLLLPQGNARTMVAGTLVVALAAIWITGMAFMVTGPTVQRFGFVLGSGLVGGGVAWGLWRYRGVHRSWPLWDPWLAA